MTSTCPFFWAKNFHQARDTVEVLQSHHFRSGEQLVTTLHRYARLYNQQLPQSALGSKSPLQAMKDWHKVKSESFKKTPYYLPGCDN